jgi:NAD(P)-dependent dehydrogenase (short-subunit alcohol dehydrogenase family)
MSLQGKVFAITGGASGIGLATAKILATRGATICIADVDAKAMEDAEAYFSKDGTISFMATLVDVSKRAEVDGWIDSIVQKFGRLDGAANVAGINGLRPGAFTVATLEDDEWDKIIAVNLTGVMYCLRAQLGKIEDGGSIVNVSSIHGLKGKPATYLSSRVSLNVNSSVLRVSHDCSVRCEQTRRHRLDQGGSSGERSQEYSHQLGRSRSYIYSADAEDLGYPWARSQCTLR